MVTKITDVCFCDGRENKDIYFKDNIITDITSKKLAFDKEIKGNGCYVSAGFIDLHLHGGGGYDFADGDTESVKKAAYTHALHGSTTIFPTCTSSSYRDTIMFLQNIRDLTGYLNIEGSHLEGPYFSEAMCGAQNTKYLKDCQTEEYESFYEAAGGTLKRITFAPERKGSEQMCKYFLEKGVVCSYGHTEATFDQLEPFINMGCNLANHLYSGMEGVTRKNSFRRGGGVEAALLMDEAAAEIICDSKHLPRELLKLVHKVKGADKTALITDAMRAAGTDMTEAYLGPKRDRVLCKIRDGVAYTEDLKSFAGSVATSDVLLKTGVEFAGISLPEVIKMMTETPARLMNLKDRGRLEEGLIADIVLFDKTLKIKKVICKGEELWK